MSLIEFAYRPLPWNVIFGRGALARLPAELDKLGYKRAVILSTPGRAAMAAGVASLIGDRYAGSFEGAKMHIPVEDLNQAIGLAQSLNADCSIALGGGSTTGFGKAMALRIGLPNVVIPTTYAGSEMTNLWGISEGGHKATGRDDRVVPKLVIYDPELSLSVPARVAGPSGMNAMAHAVVNLTSLAANPFIALLAEEAIRRLAASLPRVVAAPDDFAAREQALLGTCLAGAALGAGVNGLHHRLCHVIGGSFNTPHAETHTILLPYATAYNAAATPDGTARVARALGVEDAARGLQMLAKSLGAPTALSALGLSVEDMARAAQLVLANPLNNPEPVTYERVHHLLLLAQKGADPRV